MKTSELDRLPVIIGIGEITDKPARGESGFEPLELIVQAARRADRDAGDGWLNRVDSFYLVPQLTWPYPDLSANIAKTLGLEAQQLATTVPSGDSPVRFLMEAAESIALGQAQTVLVCGAEAMQSLRTAVGKGQLPAHWTPTKEPPKSPDGADFVSPLATKYGLQDPTEAYTLYENATRAAWGLSVVEARTQSAELWSNYSEIASRNPYGWDSKHYTAQEIAEVTPANRPISFPYLKRMVTQMYVNQGSAYIVTSLAEARAGGVPDDQMIYVWSGAGAVDIEDFLSRDRFDRSLPMNKVLNKALTANELRAQDLDALELYSCFPCMPRMALKALPGLRDGVQSTVAGGMSFFGGPLGNYMSHAITAMVRTLRSGEANTGLLYGNGGWVTKHHTAVLSTQPPTNPPRNYSVQEEVESGREPTPRLLESYEGPGVIETYMVKYGPSGNPDSATVVLRTPDGDRSLAYIPREDTDNLQALVNGVAEPIGLSGEVVADNEGQRWYFHDLPSGQ